MTGQDQRPTANRDIRVWDLPVRVFHWALSALVIVSFVTGQIGGNAMQYHEWSGLCILTLVVFRLLWGFAGSRTARFVDFVRGPRAVLRYAGALLRGRSSPHAGHNPLGGWMVLLLLGSLLLQAGTGLFANDDVMIEGPLAQHVSKDTSDWLTRIHHINFNVLAVLISLHIAAALSYLLVKRDNLIVPMITGRKPASGVPDAPDLRGGRVWLAILLLAVSAALVWSLLRL